MTTHSETSHRSSCPAQQAAPLASVGTGVSQRTGLCDAAVIADKLAIAADARAKGRTAEDAARLVGWSRATLYRHQQALKGRENI